MNMELAFLIPVSVVLGALVLLVVVTVGKKWGQSMQTEEQSKERSEKKANGTVGRTAASKKQTKQQRLRKERPQQHAFSHQLLAASLKAHSGNISSLDFSSNGKYLASCSEDRTIRIWSTKDFMEKEHRCIRANVELDHAVFVRFSPDSRAFITWLANGETIRIFKMSKKEDGSITYIASPEEFSQRHKASVINIGIADTGKFIMTASNDTTILIWNLKGEVMASINTNQMTNAYATISPCGRFVASCGFTPDVKVWEVCFGKGGDFKEVTRAFDLKGHSAGVHYFAFSNDSRRMASISKDNTWKLWDTDVEYKKQQDPYLLMTGNYTVVEPCHIALSPDARVVAISCGNDMALYNTEDGKLEEEFHNVHSEDISDLRFDINSRFVVTTGDRVIRVFHNTPGYRAAIRDMEKMLKKASNSCMRQRLQQQIKEAKSALNKVCNSRQ
ncbi:transducin beta-like protein 2 [Erpetoichthys calabaricus]|nr:transducin beta-like protein 2 [Erpetoichthys calabaricus]